jgi:hypothetical protein
LYCRWFGPFQIVTLRLSKKPGVAGLEAYGRDSFTRYLIF